jgi:NWD NACHT NTPase-like protein
MLEVLDNKSEAGEKPIQSDSSAVENPFPHAVSTDNSELLDDNSKKRVASPCRDQNQGRDRDLWMRAYLMLKEREPELAELYENHLTTHNFLTGSLTPESVKSMVERLSQEREKKQWRINLFQKEVKIREQAEKLIKFLLVSDNVIKTALSSAQPYAALAWSGVSIVLPVGQRYSIDISSRSLVK